MCIYSVLPSSINLAAKNDQYIYAEREKEKKKRKREKREEKTNVKDQVAFPLHMEQVNQKAELKKKKILICFFHMNTSIMYL
jgi:hypothetical protein